MPNAWYVITGGPSSGKTSLLNRLSKKGFVTVPEAARIVIDEALDKGISVAELRSDEFNFQKIVLQRKIEIESSLDKNLPTFLDRGMHDSTAYFNFCKFTPEDWMNGAIQAANYKKVFLLSPLETYAKDYARTESEEDAQAIHDELKKTYMKSGIELITVPRMPLNKRVKFVLHHIQ